MSCTSFKICSSLEATTNTVGTEIETSSAWLGPDKTPILTSGISSSITSSSVFNVSFSKPFEQIITGFLPTYCLYCLNTSLVNFEGVTCIIKSLSLITSSKLFEQKTLSGTVTSGKNLHFL